MLTETAYAKINLALHVRKRRDDGYHDLDTIFAFVDCGDEVTAELSDTLELSITGPFAAGLASDADNLVTRTALLMQAHYHVRDGARLTLEKNLPIASGIGGGSADAAATARLLNKLWNINAKPSELEQLTEALGADVPACISSSIVRGVGTGTTLEPIDGGGITATPILLVNPQIPLATGPVFKGWSGHDQGPLPAGSAYDAALHGRNDLESSACDLIPEIAVMIEILRASGAFVSKMSGSGATCFGLYHDKISLMNAQEEIARKRPNWWQLAGRLR